MKTPIMCVVCGIPESCVKLVRMTWKDSKTSTYSGVDMDICVAKNPKSNDVLVCVECIKGIKRIPFSDFETIECPF